MQQDYHIQAPSPIDQTPAFRPRELLTPAMKRLATTAATKDAGQLLARKTLNRAVSLCNIAPINRGKLSGGELHFGRHTGSQSPPKHQAKDQPSPWVRFVQILEPTMIHLPNTVAAWGTPDFEDVFKNELERLDAGLLPLQKGLSGTSYVTDSPHSAMIIGVTEDGAMLRAKVGVFYGGILTGCSCADDPTPLEEQPEYCVLLLDIDRQSGETTVILLPH